jgi:hypothetical protein
LVYYSWLHCWFPGGKFAFSIYDFEGKDVVDAFNLGDVLRALGCTPTQKLVEKMGGTKKKGECAACEAEIGLLITINAPD